MLAAELEDQPSVDRPEHGAPLARALAQALHVVEQPLDLGRGEVGVEHEARALAHERLVTLRAQLLAALGRAAVLPHDRPVQRLSGRRVPHAHGLALVGDPDRHELARASFGVRERLAATAWVTSQISPASCSTHPGRGKCCVNSR